MKIAIYEPDPRICGPDTWAQMLQRGFTALGHECDLVAFTKSGRPRDKWGRIHQSGSSLSCKLLPTRTAKTSLAGEVLDEYDLIVLTDLKTPRHDKLATDEDSLPEYWEILSSTNTRFTSALHGRWYYGPQEVPQGLSEASGSPFIEELLALDNFSGFLIAHASDFDRYCKRLQGIPKTLLPLPYVPCVDDAAALGKRCNWRSIGVIGRIIPTKHRHILHEMFGRGLHKNTHVYYGGACSVTHGPSETFVMQEQLQELGFRTDWGQEGVKRTKPFSAIHDDHAIEIRYLGLYNQPFEILEHARVHVGITDADFSGGLLEFATLEAIDCGCVPVITAPFIPHATSQIVLMVIDRAFIKFGRKTSKNAPNDVYEDISATIEKAYEAYAPELLRFNRECMRVECDPVRHAKAFIEGAL